MSQARSDNRAPTLAAAADSAARPVSVHIEILDGPLPPQGPPRDVANAGAVLCFEGVVRPLEAGRAIAALDYEAYEPMAANLLRRLGEEVSRAHGLIDLCVEHSRGRVPAGECSFRLRVASPHRPEALRAVEEFVDRMKRDVPIWKTAVYDG
jgi:molybdopterin synthase catalytic subunit